ncbi:hypothetical protein [Winogradskyella ouciana]|uniref:hypothetical protein n=1 Tax=Winogradskyella ouciana TaxID=2608631 RepID=UPI003D27D7C8
MKKNTILYLLIIILIIANGFFLYNYLGHDDKKRDRQKDRTSFIIKKLGFEGEQIDSFKNFKDLHRERMRLISDDIKVLKDSLFDKLPEDEVSEYYIDSITSLIAEKEKAKDKEVFAYFKRVRDLCQGDQKEKFDKILKDALNKGNRNRSGKSKRDKGHRPPPKD